MGGGISDKGTGGDGKVDLKHIISEMRLFRDGLKRLDNPPKTVKRLVKDVESIYASLQVLQDVKEWSLLGEGIVQQSKATISSCTRAYDLFETSGIAWNPKIIGYAAMQIKAMSEQLSNCTLTINSIISIANLYSSIPSGQFTEGIKDTISTKHAELERGITIVNKQLVVLEYKLNDLNLSSDEEAAEVEGKVEVLGQLDEQLKGLKSSQDLLKELLSKIVVWNSGFQAQTINGGVNGIIFGTGGNGIVGADGNSGFQAGTINGGVWGLVFGGK